MELTEKSLSIFFSLINTIVTALSLLLKRKCHKSCIVFLQQMIRKK